MTTPKPRAKIGDVVVVKDRKSVFQMMVGSAAISKGNWIYDSRDNLYKVKPFAQVNQKDILQNLTTDEDFNQLR